MLKLININKTNTYIEANYIPEDSNQVGYIKFDFTTNEKTSMPAEGFERTYPSMALNGLKRILDDLKSDPSYQVPRERLVMWY
ncbi:MAG: hypothetical protein J1F63_05935 [Oscillospiraceae bacterium]|nr:hypothetical protein [Oscillospiraceae bacterium]